jgi:hypothetical protein
LGGEGAGAAIAGDTGQANGFVDEELRGVFADSVVGDEARGLLVAGLSGLVAEAVGLGEEIVAVGCGVWEECGAADGGVEASGAGGGEGGGEGGVVAQGGGYGLFEGDPGRGCGGWRRGCG